MTLSVFFGLGILLLTHIQHSGSANQSGLDSFLFGQAASLVQADVIVFGAVSLFLIGAILFAFKEMKLVSFDSDFAGTIGVPIRLIELIMTTLLVLSVVVGVQAVGVVLMAAMLITPAAAARYWTDSLARMIFLAILFGVISGYGGSFVSYLEPRMPTGPWIVVVCSLLFFISLLLAPRRGMVPRFLMKKRTQRTTLDENILKTMHRLGEKAGSHAGPWTISDVQRLRSLSPARLRTGLSRLTVDRYMERVSGSGEPSWRLTPEGVRRGARITRLHRLWEVYLTEYLQIASDHVHDDAETIEHVLTPELEAELEQLLNRPTSDPHSQNIPYS